MAMYSVNFTKHTLECRVIVLGVLGKPFVGEERRRVWELCVGLDRSLLEVVGVGLVTCVEVGLMNRVYELQVREEVEWVRQEVREVQGEIKIERESLTSWAHVDGMTGEHKTHDLCHMVHVHVWRCADTRTRPRTYTHVFVLMCSVWKSVAVVMSSLVSVSWSCNVTTKT